MKYDLKLDKKGRVLIPSKVRRMLFGDCENAEMYVDNDRLTIMPIAEMDIYDFMLKVKNAYVKKHPNVRVFTRNDDIVHIMSESDGLVDAMLYENETVELGNGMKMNAYEWLSMANDRHAPENIYVTRHLTLNDVATILADGFAESVGFIDVNTVGIDYKLARATLVNTLKVSEDELTYELVQAQMLAEGKSLQLTSPEGEIIDLTLKKLVSGIKAYVNGDIKGVVRMIRDGDYDSNDYDSMLQYAAYGEVVYG